MSRCNVKKGECPIHVPRCHVAVSDAPVLGMATAGGEVRLYTLTDGPVRDTILFQISIISIISIIIMERAAVYLWIWMKAFAVFTPI